MTPTPLNMRERASEIWDVLDNMNTWHERTRDRCIDPIEQALIQAEKEGFERGLRADPDIKAALIYDAGRADGINEAAETAMDHNGMKGSKYMWGKCAGEIAEEILKLLTPKPGEGK